MIDTQGEQRSLLGAAALGLLRRSGGPASPPGAGAGDRIAIDADDIAGIVTSARGPEAGVWVIAETTDTPTKLRKIVVTDDRGRYLLPDLPTKATFSVWVRGYGLVDSPPVRSMPGRELALTARRGAGCADRGAHLSGQLLVLADRHPAGEGVSRHRTDRQRHRPGDAHAAPLDQSDQGQLQRLPPDGQPGDARDPEGARHVRRRASRRGTRACRPGRTARA